MLSGPAAPLQVRLVRPSLSISASILFLPSYSGPRIRQPKDAWGVGVWNDIRLHLDLLTSLVRFSADSSRTRQARLETDPSCPRERTEYSQ